MTLIHLRDCFPLRRKISSNRQSLAKTVSISLMIVMMAKMLIAMMMMRKMMLRKKPMMMIGELPPQLQASISDMWHEGRKCPEWKFLQARHTDREIFGGIANINPSKFCCLWIMTAKKCHLRNGAIRISSILLQHV